MSRTGVKVAARWSMITEAVCTSNIASALRSSATSGSARSARRRRVAPGRLTARPADRQLRAMSKSNARRDLRSKSRADMILGWWMPLCFFTGVVLILSRDMVTWTDGESLTLDQWRAHLIIPFQGLLWWVYCKVDT